MYTTAAAQCIQPLWLPSWYCAPALLGNAAAATHRHMATPQWHLAFVANVSASPNFTTPAEILECAAHIACTTYKSTMLLTVQQYTCAQTCRGHDPCRHPGATAPSTMEMCMPRAKQHSGHTSRSPHATAASTCVASLRLPARRKKQKLAFQ